MAFAAPFGHKRKSHQSQLSTDCFVTRGRCIWCGCPFHSLLYWWVWQTVKRTASKAKPFFPPEPSQILEKENFLAHPLFMFEFCATFYLMKKLCHTESNCLKVTWSCFSGMGEMWQPTWAGPRSKALFQCLETCVPRNTYSPWKVGIGATWRTQPSCTNPNFPQTAY